jgi:hypothetical protein
LKRLPILVHCELAVAQPKQKLRRKLRFTRSRCVTVALPGEGGGVLETAGAEYFV